ncbi:MAG: NADH-quinone oxidoreductase subunit NuoB [Nitrososphaerales archaeon]
MSGLISFARKKSPWIMHLPCGGCNGCDITIAACITPRFDIERFGCIVTQNPRHADILLVTGTVPKQLASSLKRVYDQVPEPKVVVAVGACAVSGGVFLEGTYSIRTPLTNVLPVDVFVPGCPPKEEAVILGVAKAADILSRKSKGKGGDGVE